MKGKPEIKTLSPRTTQSKMNLYWAGHPGAGVLAVEDKHHLLKARFQTTPEMLLLMPIIRLWKS
jgi:hypothetical protein